MSLEILPNELLLEVFEFLGTTELFRAFHNLNTRFNRLLFTHYHHYRINFHSVVKYQSEFLSQNYLLLITNQIISIRLSDKNDETQSQTDFFYSSNLQLNQFIHLRSLSLCYVTNEMILSKLLIDCQDLIHLTHLKMIKCRSEFENSTARLSDSIWSLSKLTHYSIDTEEVFNTPTVISSSLRYLSIASQSYEIIQITDLFQRTPCLQYLHTPSNALYYDYHANWPSILQMTTLKLFNVISSDAMVNILRAMPNLTYLKIDGKNIKYDGYQWEKVLDKYLPKLKVFSLRMWICGTREKDNEDKIEEWIDSFCNQFWLEKHRWYIRCHYNARTKFFYTLPYAFRDIDLQKFKIPYKSTCPNDNDYVSYNRVNKIFCRYTLPTNHFSFERFSNIRNLSIELCLDEKFWRNVPKLYQLSSITILKTNDDASNHLQSLLDRAPHLYSLAIRSWPSFLVPLIKNSNPSLRRLDLQVEDSDLSFNNEVCKKFIQSPLAIQCQELLIKNFIRQNILDLINMMTNLRLLSIDTDPNFNMSFQSFENDLPSTCILSKSSSNLAWIYLNKS